MKGRRSVYVPDVLEIACLSIFWGAGVAGNFRDVHGRRDEVAQWWGDFESWYPFECWAEVDGHCVSEGSGDS